MKQTRRQFVRTLFVATQAAAIGSLFPHIFAFPSIGSSAYHYLAKIERAEWSCTMAGPTGRAQAGRVVEGEAGDTFGPPEYMGSESSPVELDAATPLLSGMPRAAKSLDSFMVRRKVQPRRLRD